MKWLLLLVVCPALWAQDTVTRNQEWCARKAEANMKETKETKPEIAASILTYMYEYSPRHHACVAVMEYKATKNGKPQAQIMARNMATNQPMKGYDEIYLIPIENKKERRDAINFLFAEYSK